jgi:hypothetical protein
MDSRNEHAVRGSTPSSQSTVNAWTRQATTASKDGDNCTESVVKVDESACTAEERGARDEREGSNATMVSTSTGARLSPY